MGQAFNDISDKMCTTCMSFCQDINGCPCLVPWVERCNAPSCSTCGACRGAPNPATHPYCIKIVTGVEHANDGTLDVSVYSGSGLVVEDPKATYAKGEIV